MTMRRIHLHGKFRDLCEDGLLFDVSTVAEAINALCKMTNGAFNPVPGEVRHSVVVPGFPTVWDLKRPLRDDELDIHIVPSFGGGGGMMSIIIGVIMIIVCIFAPELIVALAAMLPEILAPTVAGVFFGGMMNIAMGVIQLTSPAPSAETSRNGSTSSSTSPNPEASKYLGLGKNTTKSGTRIPILYGRFRVYGQVLSAQTEAVDVAV